MNNLIRKYRNWRYRRLYRKLFLIYALKYDFADLAGEQASTAFQWITGRDWFDLVSKPDFAGMKQTIHIPEIGEVNVAKLIDFIADLRVLNNSLGNLDMPDYMETPPKHRYMWVVARRFVERSRKFFNDDVVRFGK